nr:PREDICTED: uncharacterized protein LOC109031439 [Bemisia tabaci]
MFSQSEMRTGMFGQSEMRPDTFGQSEMSTGMFGQSEMKTGMFGQSEMRTDTFGQSEMRTGMFGQSEMRTDTFGQPEIRSDTFGQSETRTDTFGQSEMRTDTFGQSEMRTGAVMDQRPPRKSLFEDDADDPPSGSPTPEPASVETKYSQINENLQSIISFCKNKLGTIQNQPQVLQGELKHCKAQQQQIFFEDGFPDSIVEGDAGMASAKFSYRFGAGQVPQKMRFRSPDSYMKCQQEKQRDTSGVESHGTGPFIPGGRARSVPASFALRLQTVEQEAAARKMAVRRWIRPQSPEVPAAGPGPLLTKLRNLTGSPIIPLDCPKCQLEISKRELETMRRNLYRAQGLHCCGCGCGGDEEPTGLAEWACTCGVGRQRGRRDLHREKGRDLALPTPVPIPVGLGHTDRFNGCLRTCSFHATPVPVPVHCPGNNGCCRHSDVIHDVVPNFVHHEDTHGKCRDCHRQDMLHDAMKLKNSLDMQYEQQRTSTLRRHYESVGGTKCCAASGNTRWTGSDDGRWTTKAEMPHATVRKVTEIGDCVEKSGRTAGGRSVDEDGGSGNGEESGNESDSGGHKSKYLDTSCCSGESVRSNGDFAYFEERIGPYASTSVPSIDE